MSVHGPALFSLVAIAIQAIAVRAAFAVIFTVVVAETAKRWLLRGRESAAASHPAGKRSRVIILHVENVIALAEHQHSTLLSVDTADMLWQIIFLEGI
jgi:hypothetical protein